MPKYRVDVEARVRETYYIEAENEEAAAESVSDPFSWEPSTRDTVDAEVVEVEEVAR